jgi:2-polyprenyl-6-hydroxyphenyl methylase/3-demethylubiquinone-9 3-methyltransferase
VGGGKNPVVAPERKTELDLRVIGVDIDGGELASAPAGSYDQTVCADIGSYQGPGDGDLVICQALLEHVRDSGAALRAIASILKPGGRALIFVPSRNAVYARLNLLLPEALKRKILFTVFPETRRDHGFRAFYDRCTPAGFVSMAAQQGLLTEDCRLYFRQLYTSLTNCDRLQKAKGGPTRWAPGKSFWDWVSTGNDVTSIVFQGGDG